MTNELTIIHRIKKNLNKLEEIKDEDLISQLEKFKSVPEETLVSVFELDENGIDWDLIEDRLREQVEVTHEKGFGIIGLISFFHSLLQFSFSLENQHPKCHLLALLLVN